MKAGLAVLSAQGALGAYDKLPRLTSTSSRREKSPSTGYRRCA